MSNSHTRKMSQASRNAVLLLLFVVFSGFLLWLINDITTSRIQQSDEQWLQQSLMEVLSDDLKEHSPTITKLNTNDYKLSGKLPLPIYQVKANGATEAFILTIEAPDGYNGSIEMLLGVNRSSAITGVRVTRHRETPGLGDDIEIRRSDWIRNFDGLSLDSIPETAWSVKRANSQFDAFTGATITPQAVINAVHQALLWYENQKNSILN